MSEKAPQLLIKENELIKVKEDNKLLQTELFDSKETTTYPKKGLLDTEAKLTVSYTEIKQIKDDIKLQQVKHLPIYFIVYDNHKCLNTVTVCTQQEENKVVITQLNSKLSETISQLMMKENELTKVKEDNKLLVKQFRERKDKKRRETILQVCPY